MRIRNDPTNGENPSAIRNQIELRTEDGKEREYQESMIGKSAGKSACRDKWWETRTVDLRRVGFGRLYDTSHQAYGVSGD